MSPFKTIKSFGNLALFGPRSHPLQLISVKVFHINRTKMSKRGELKRTTLLRNLKSIIERIPDLDLPADIAAVYAFGGILREKRKLHDFDLLFLYSMTQDQVLRWERFRDNFSTYGLGPNYAKLPISELRDMFMPFQKRGISLHHAVQDEKVASLLVQKGVPPSWAGCFSWTEIFTGYQGDGIFHPDLDRVIRRILIEKQFRGLQVQIQSRLDFEKEHTWLVAKNYVLAWSPEKPDIEENVEGRSQQDRMNYITKELDFFINEQIPQLRNGSNHRTRSYLEAKEAVAEGSAEAGIRIDLELLDKQHANIEHTGTESYTELLQKCEMARNEMRNYHREIIVLHQIALALQNWVRMRREGYIQRKRPKDQIAQWVIGGVEKAAVKENDIRQILRTLSLPEHNVITVKGYGFTYYRLPENKEDKKRLLKEAKLQRIRRGYLIGIRKATRPLERDADVDMGLTENGEPKWLEIIVQKEVEQQNEEERKTIVRDLKGKNFEIKNWSWAIEGTKQTFLSGKENLKQLQEIAKRMLTKR